MRETCATEPKLTHGPYVVCLLMKHRSEYPGCSLDVVVALTVLLKTSSKFKVAVCYLGPF